jgi:cellulose synthase/poly-beta-1,6-N-acetylglucosamine synthase-like glycosyltransferase
VSPPVQLASIVIAARKPGAALAAKVRHLLGEGQTLRECIVVLDGDDPEAREGLASLEGDRCTVLTLDPPRGKAAALNIGVEQARGDVLVMMDARQRISEGGVDHLCAWFRRSDVGAVGGLLDVESSDIRSTLDAYWAAETRLRFDEAQLHSSVGVSGALYAMRRALWRRLPQGLLLDDVYVPMHVAAAGYRVAFEPRAVAYDIPFRETHVEFSRKVRTLTGNFQLLAWWPEFLLSRYNPIRWQFLSHKVSRLFTAVSVSGVGVAILLLLGAWWPAAVLMFSLAGLLAFLLPERWQPTGSDAVRVCLMLLGALSVASFNAMAGRWNVWGAVGSPVLPRTIETS